jgi:hypothetical protein
MAISTFPDRRARSAVAFVVRVVLPVVLVVPTAVLFGLQRQSTGDDSAFATRERHGVAYLRTLVPLEIELVNAQSAAAAGNQVPREPLVAAVGSAAALDGEFGGELLMRDRWKDVRTKIEAVPPTGAPATLFAAYGEAVDLLVELIDKVRDASGLARDPHAEAYYLADGGAQELPEGIAAAGLYTGLVLQARRLPAAGQGDALFGIAAARSDLVGSAGDLAEDVQLAAQGTASESLDAALLTKIDGFSRATDALVPSAATASATLSADPAQLAKARDDLVRAGADLSASLLSEIDGLLRDRVSGLQSREAVAIAALVVAVLLGLAGPVLGLLPARRRAARHSDAPLVAIPQHDGRERARAAR